MIYESSTEVLSNPIQFPNMKLHGIVQKNTVLKTTVPSVGKTQHGHGS